MKELDFYDAKNQKLRDAVIRKTVVYVLLSSAIWRTEHAARLLRIMTRSSLLRENFDGIIQSVFFGILLKFL